MTWSSLWATRVNKCTGAESVRMFWIFSVHLCFVTSITWCWQHKHRVSSRYVQMLPCSLITWAGLSSDHLSDLSGVGSQVTQKLFSVQVLLLTGYVRVLWECPVTVQSSLLLRTHSFTVDACLYFTLFMLLQTLKKKILCRLIVRTAISQYSYSLHLKWKRLVTLNSANVCVSHN